MDSPNIPSVDDLGVLLGAVVAMVQEVAVAKQGIGQTTGRGEKVGSQEIVKPAISGNDVVVDKLVRYESESMLPSTDQQDCSDIGKNSRGPDEQGQSSKNLRPYQAKVEGLTPRCRPAIGFDLLCCEDLPQLDGNKDFFFH